LSDAVSGLVHGISSALALTIDPILELEEYEAEAFGSALAEVLLVTGNKNTEKLIKTIMKAMPFLTLAAVTNAVIVPRIRQAYQNRRKPRVTKTESTTPSANNARARERSTSSNEENFGNNSESVQTQDSGQVSNVRPSSRNRTFEIYSTGPRIDRFPREPEN
jgi:hypothetical protein